MMRCNSFGRSVGFAAVAAAGSAAWVICAAPFVGVRRALALYLVGITAAYVGGLADGVRRRLRAFTLTAIVGLGLAVIAPGVRELGCGLAVVLAVGRSGFLYWRSPARAAITEAVLVVGGLVFADGLGGSSLRALVFGVWGFFLVQSLFFLVPGQRVRSTEARADPFEAAHARAMALLERGFV